MFSQAFTNASLDSFMAQTDGKKIVILYPWANYRNVFLSVFVSGESSGLLYHRAKHSGASLVAWLHDLLDEVRLAQPCFGAATDPALSAGSAADQGAALAEDLAHIEPERVILYLDELDRVFQAEGFDPFMAALVDNLNSSSQVVVNSRVLTYGPWTERIKRGQAALVGAKPRSHNLTFTAEAEPKPQLEVYAFGRGHAISNGLEISRWDGALPRNLFFYFMDNPLVTRDQIFELFWPKLSIRDATNVFHVTKRKITERISVNVDDGKNYELTSYATGFYVPSDKLVRHYDVTEFEDAVERALYSADAREQQELYSRAIDIYKAPYLYPLDLPWIVARRQQLQTMYGEALNGLARLKADDGEWDVALGFYTRALRELWQREDIHRAAMQMYINLGRLADAHEHFAELERLLQRELGIKPSRVTQAVLADQPQGA